MNLETYAIECVHIGRGHERSIECVDVDKNASFLATGGWDNMLKIWAASKNPYETHFLVLISFIKLLNFILIKYCYKLLIQIHQMKLFDITRAAPSCNPLRAIASAKDIIWIYVRDLLRISHDASSGIVMDTIW